MEDNNQPKEEVEKNPQEKAESVESKPQAKTEAKPQEKVESKPQANPTNDFKVSQNQPKPEKKKGKGKKAVLAIILILIIAIAAGAIYYFMVYTKPEEVYKRAIDSTLNSFTEELDSADYKTLKSSVELSIDADVDDADEDVIDAINNSKIGLDIQVDKENKKFLLDIESNYDSEDLLNMQFYVNGSDEETYLKLSDLLDKYIEVDLDSDFYEEMSQLFEETVDTESNKKQAEIVKEELNKIIKSEYCSSQKEDIMINGNTVNATKNSLKLTAEQFKNEFTSLVNNLIDNEEFTGSNADTSSIEESLDTIVENLEDLEDEGVTFEIDLYTDGLLQDVVMVAVSMGNDEQKVVLTFAKNAEDNYSFEVIENETALCTGSIVTEKKNDNEGKITFEIASEDVGTVKLNIDYSTKYDEEVEDVDTKNSTTLTKMSTSDQKKLISNLSKSKSPLYQLISYYTGYSKLYSTSSLLSGSTSKKTTSDDDDDDDENTTSSNTSTSNSSTSSSSTSTEKSTGSDNVIITYDDAKKITYGVPTGYTVSTISDSYKRLTKGDAKIRITSKLSDNEAYYTSLEETKKTYADSESYENVTLSSAEEVDINGTKFNTATLSYKSTYGTEYNKTYYWTEVSSTYVMDVEIENGDDLSEDEVKEVLSIKVEDNN